MKFSELKLSPSILKSLKDMRFHEMTLIQEKSIPLLLKGKDVIGQADTGTGKTAAFAVPIIEGLKLDSKEVQALVLCPTRELCCQVAQQFNELMKYQEAFTCVPIYGGQKIKIQLKEIKKNPQVVIGTPGRLLDHIQRGSLRLRSTRIVVLDEADLMLGMGFKDDIESILRNAKSRKQTILFSATMQAPILQLAKRHQKKAEYIKLQKKKEKKAAINQLYYDVESKSRTDAIKSLLTVHRVDSALIFCNTKLQVDMLSSNLKKDGYNVAKLHGDLKQNRRDAVMRKFKDGEIRILIATDIAARGIDVDDIGAVFNYNLPRDSEDYVHRIGRTGRAGKEGLAFTFINSKELQQLKRIASKHRLELSKDLVPRIKAHDFSSVSALENILIEGTLSKNARKKHLKLIKDIQEEAKEDKDVVRIYIKGLSQKKNNIFGLRSK